MTEYKAIAIKEKPKSLEEKGVVKLLFIWDEEKDGWVLPDENIFKTKRCTITTDYSTKIDTYKRDEAFVLKKVNFSEEYSEWRCYGNQNEPLKGEFIPVIKGDLPNQGSRELKLDVEAQYIFIENNEFIYGPFQVSFDDKLIADPYDKPLGLQQYHIIKAPKEALSLGGVLQSSLVDGHEFCFITSYSNLRAIKKVDWEVDYINNSALLKYVLSVSKKGEKNKNLRTKQEISSLQKVVEETYGKQSQTDPRVKRALDLLSNTEQKFDSDIREFESVVNEWMGSENGRKYVSQLTAEREKINKEIDDLNGKASEARDLLAKNENRSNALKGELQDLRKNIDELTNQKITLGEEQKRKSLEEADQKFKEIEAELNKVETELNEKLKNLTSVNSLEEIEEEEKSVKRNIKKLEEERRQLKSDIEASQGVLSKQNLRNVIIEHDSLLKILKSGGVVDEQQNINYVPIKLASKSIESDLPNKETLIKSITKNLNSNDRRRFEEYEIANLLICTQQNLLTILQGTPGSGKTSTAIGLAKALGLCEESESTSSHFLNIAVARGWVSSRDILGYYNSLKGSYQPAKTGLYQFLLMGEDSQSSEAPRLILLDEANLSPIEHYWSDFIGMCDTEGFYKSIDTGAPTGQKQLTPNRYDNLRFIATINSDETTEPLSPRLLDRAPVINMDIPHNGFFENADEFELDGAIRIDLMKKFFDADESKRKEINEYPRLNKFIEFASKNDKTYGDSINLSMRKRNAISNYLSVAMEIMEESCAQDYAISQFVIPLLKGDKKGFNTRLEKLKEIAIECEFERSKNIVDGILERGDQYLGNYSFF